MAGSLTGRLAVGAAFGLAALVALAAVVAEGPGAYATAAESRAVVVIDDGLSRSSYCIRFSGEIDGLDALRLAGADAVVAGFGALGGAVCSIDGTGCSASACLTCQAPRHWNYLRAPAGSGQLRMSGVGASSTTVRDGDVEAWAWGASANPGAAPSVDSVCGARTTTTSSPTPNPPQPPPAQVPPPQAGGQIPPAVVTPPTIATPHDPAATTTTSTTATPDQGDTGGGEQDPPTGDAAAPAAEAGAGEVAAPAADPGDETGSGTSWLGFIIGLSLVGGLGVWAALLRRRSAA